jgi:hypothetical protein
MGQATVTLFRLAGEGKKTIILLEESQDLPARPSDKRKYDNKDVRMS